VRLVSGDHLETAKAVAKKSGILTEEEEKDGTYAVMTGDKFEKMVGKDEDAMIEKMPMFQEIMSELRVLARAKPCHKYMIVCGLQELHKSVTVIGDGINDVKAIMRADVGFAMGSGCSAAKEVSDIILTGDDFEATTKSIKWGRNIFHNVGRFLQF